MLADVFELIADHYEGLEPGYDPPVKQVWVEGYIRTLQAQGLDNDQLVNVWDDIFALAIFLDRFQALGIADLMSWDYSTALKWMDTHIAFQGKFILGLDNARRILGHLIPFCKYLTEQGHLDGYDELQQAYDLMCGGSTLKVMEPPANA